MAAELYFSPATLLNALLEGILALLGVAGGAYLALDHHRTTSRRQRREDLAVEPMLALYLAMAHLHAKLSHIREAHTHEELASDVHAALDLCGAAIQQHRTATSFADQATANLVHEVFGIAVIASNKLLAMTGGARNDTVLEQLEAAVLYAASLVRCALRTLLGLEPLDYDAQIVTAHQAAMASARVARAPAR